MIKQKEITKSKASLKNYVEVNGIKYYVDNRRVVFETTKKELAMAIWLSKKLNKKVEILPKVYQPENIKTADYLIAGEKWDLKEITSSRNNAVYSRIRKQKNQSPNFVIDISKSKLTIKSAIKQIDNLAKDFNWLDKILIKKENEYEIIKKQKKS